MRAEFACSYPFQHLAEQATSEQAQEVSFLGSADTCTGEIGCKFEHLFAHLTVGRPEVLLRHLQLGGEPTTMPTSAGQT